MDAYEIITKPIWEWCEKNYFSDFLVTILVNDREETQYLEFDGDGWRFVWNNDWWEGEEDVRLLGFLPIANIHIYNSPEDVRSDKWYVFKWNSDGSEADDEKTQTD